MLCITVWMHSLTTRHALLNNHRSPLVHGLSVYLAQTMTFLYFAHGKKENESIKISHNAAALPLPTFGSNLSIRRK